MNNYSNLYWLTRINYINGLMLAITVASGIFLILFHLWYYISKDNAISMKETWDDTRHKRNLTTRKKIFYPIFVVFLLLTVLLQAEMK